MNRLTNVFLFTVAIGALWSCHHHDPLPDPLNRVRCTVNGTPWAAEATEYYFQPDSLNVLALHDTHRQSLHLALGRLQTGENAIGMHACTWSDGGSVFRPDMRFANRVWIDELDVEGQLVKGRFQLVLVDDQGQELHVEAGVLDLKEPRSE